MVDISFKEQVQQAEAAYLEAHINATDAAAAYLDLKRKIGNNEAERKERKSATPDDVYAGYLSGLPAVEDVKNATAAILERADKALKVARELYQGEVAATQERAANRYHEAVSIADTTALRYAVMPGNYTTHAEFRTRYPSKKDTAAAVPESELPF